MNKQPVSLSRRDLLKMMGAGTAALALAACAPVDAPSGGAQEGGGAASAEKTVVRIGSWDSKTAEPIEDDVITAFNEQFPDIVIEMEFNPDAYTDKLLTAMAGGTAPDVYLWWNFPSMVSRGGIEDLTSYVDGPNGIDPEIYYKQVLDYNRVGDGLYGLPKDFTPRAYYYNKSLFDAAGVDYPTNDWTTDDLLQISEALTQGEGPEKQYGFFTFAETYALQGYVWQAGGDYISLDGMMGSGYCDSEATTSVLDWHAALSLTAEVAPTPGTVSGQQGGADQLFKAGKLAMYDTGRWPQSQFKEVEGLDFGTALPPIDAATGERVTVLHEAGFCLNPASPLKEGAGWEVLKFEAGAEAQRIRTEAGWAVPALPAVVEELQLLSDPIEKTWFEAVPYATVSPCFMRTSAWGPADGELTNAIDTIFLGDATAAEAMGVAAPIVDGLLAEAT